MSYEQTFELVKHEILLVALLKYPPALDLPSTRVTFAPVFTHIDVDYAEPVFVKNIYNSQKMYKALILIFTCASSRGI